MSCPRIKLSKSQDLILDDVETGISLLVFAQQLRRKNAVIPDLYFTFFDVAGMSPTLILNQNAKAKERGSWSLSKCECQKLQRLYTQGGDAYGSVRNLVKASILSASKTRQFSQSKPSHTNFTPATQKIKRMKAFARFKNEFGAWT